MNDDDGTDTLNALASKLEAHKSVVAAAVHTNHDDWIELILNTTTLGPDLLREIADHDCAVCEVKRYSQAFSMVSIGRAC